MRYFMRPTQSFTTTTEQISAPPSHVVFHLQPRSALTPSIQERADSIVQNLMNAPSRAEEEREDLAEWLPMFRSHQGREAADDLALLFTYFQGVDEEIMLMLDEILQTLYPRQSLEEYMDEFNGIAHLALQTAGVIHTEEADAEAAHQESLAVATAIEEMQLAGFDEQRQELSATLHLATSGSRRVQPRVEALHERVHQASEALSALAAQTEELGARQERYDFLIEENKDLLRRL